MSQGALIVLVIAVVAVLIIIGIVAAMRGRLGMGLRKLPDESRERYARSWHEIEGRFIEQPREATQEADKVVVTMLGERGAKLDNDRQMPRDLREARQAAASDQGRQGTEGMRQAMVHYKKLVDDAVGSTSEYRQEDRKREVAS